MQYTCLSLTSAASRTVPAVVRNPRSFANARRNLGVVKTLGGHTSAATAASRTAMAAAGAAASCPAGGDADADTRAVAQFRQLVPELGGNYKGAHGKVAVVGGCLEFTGAPFFAAMSALRVGADMAYVICTPSAAPAIKSYSPELMVLPYLPEQPYGEEEGPPDQAVVACAVSRIAPWLSRASSVVVGPGLGADPAVCAAAAALMRATRELGLPLLVDGSALTHIVAKDASTVCGYAPCILTPNVAELGRIAEAVGLRLPGRMSDEWLAHAPRVAQAFQGPVVLAKGQVDLLCGPGQDATRGEEATQSKAQQPPPDSSPEPRPLLRCGDPGSLRRCGGQGDVLAGTAAAFLGWAAKQQQQQQRQKAHAGADADASGGSGSASGPGGLDTGTVALCGYVACKVMRGAARRAFEVGERSMVAGDIIPLLYPTFKAVVGTS